MRVSARTHRQMRLQNLLFTVLFLTVIGLLGWLSTRYSVQADWTASGRNTLSPASVGLLQRLDGPVSITAFAREQGPLRHSIGELIGRYQRSKPDIALSFVNPDTAPDQVRAQGITVDGELVVRYGERSEHLRELTEQGLTNVLQRLARSGERWLVFLEGHGERGIDGQANFGLGEWARQLKAKGFNLRSLNLAVDPVIPDNTSVLVIAGPQTALLPGEVALILGHLERGGNLLWLADPGPLHGLDPLAERLGVRLLDGVVVDPTTQLLGISDPRLALVAEYGAHPVTRGFEALTLFPQASAIELAAGQGWEGEAILRTVARSWVETSPVTDRVSFDAASDIAGPATLGVALTRSQGAADSARQQRAVLIGDGDFLSNTYLGNGANLDLGMNIVNWLGQDDQFIAIAAKTATDRSLELSPLAQGIIGFGAFLVLPGALLLAGLGVWLKRRRL